MRFAGYVHEIHNVCTVSLRDTAAGAWIDRWWHCRMLEGTDSLRYYPEADALYICFYEDVGYDRRFGDI